MIKNLRTLSVATLATMSLTLSACGGGGGGQIAAPTPAPTPPPASSGFWTQNVLYTFMGGSDGIHPMAGLIQGSDGNFYGTTANGGATGSNPGVGTVFKITPGGVETILHAFTGGNDGGLPDAALIQARDGNFYGTTSSGGGGAYGTVFKMTPAGIETVLYTFTGGSDGATPQASLVQGSDGDFYGTTFSGAGPATGTGNGTVFKISPGGVETVLHSFTGGTDGGSPASALVQGSDGNFYGTTTVGGIGNNGLVFKITPTGTETVLHSFTGGTDGIDPTASLVLGSDGNFYGTTDAVNINGGVATFGTVFKITPAGTLTVLYSFKGGSDGEGPSSALIQGSDGNFYGTTSGSLTGSSTAFKITPSGIETVLYLFSGGSYSGGSAWSLVQGSDGNLYGTTTGGGSSGDGTVFKLVP